jgi:hypothetical protein
MKPIASISMDVDNQWSYMKTHADAGWERYPTYLDVLIPYAVDVLAELEVHITFFLVGRDAEDEANAPFLSLITKNGHEVGNHSFEHEPWLHTYTPMQIEAEIGHADEAIRAAAKAVPVGFRGPGFSWSVELLEVLAGQGYRFDASTLPTFIGPLARLYYFWTASLDAEQKKKREQLFGKVSEGFRPLRPHTVTLPSGRTILEIPVTTIPLFRTPFHLSYLLFLAGYSWQLMSSYLETALLLCRLTGTEPSFLLHPLDLLGGDIVPQLSFFPGMKTRTNEKLELFRFVVDRLTRTYKLLPMGEYSRAIMERQRPADYEYSANYNA